MKNIAILSTSLTAGGAERIAGLLSKYLSQKYNVYFFICDSSVITYDYGGELVDLSINGVENIEQTLYECKKKYKIDHTISFCVQMNCLNVRTRCGDAIIISNRCSYGDFYRFYQSYYGKIKKWYDEADRIVSCAHGAKYDLVHNFDIDENIITPIYNFIDKEKIINNSKHDLPGCIKNFVGNSKLILNVGRLDEQKNQMKLLMQFSKLIKEGYDLKLIILGSGPMEEKLKSYAVELGVSESVRFETYCKNPFPYYKAASIMALSTDYEGLPNVVLESMVLGLPVVCVDCLSGPLELIKGTTDYSVRVKTFEVCERGVLIEQTDSDRNGDTSYFAEGVKCLLEKPELCSIISKNQQEYMKNYKNQDIFDAWVDVIETTITKKNTTNKCVLSELYAQKKIIVYGAGTYGKRIMNYILNQKVAREFLCFAVTDKTQNPESIYGVPVYQIEELLDYRKDSIVVIGSSTRFENEISAVLNDLGFKYIFSDI